MWDLDLVGYFVYYGGDDDCGGGVDMVDGFWFVDY